VGRSRVLSSNDLSINSQLLSPVVSLDVLSTNTLNLILEKNGHGAGQLDSLLFRVAETGSFTALEKGLSIDLDVDENNGAVAYCGDGLAGLVELLDELDGGLIVDKVEHGAVAAGVEDGVELGGLAEEFLEGGGLFPELLLLVEELYGLLVALEHLDGGLVEGSFTAGGRGDNDLDALVDEVIVGVGEFGLRVGSVLRDCVE
jgi:hypothetical protein